MNLGDGNFVEAAAAFGMDSLRDGRGLAASDYDGDGDLDFVVNNYRAPAHYFANEGASGNWLKLSLTGTISNRDAVGATVRVETGVQTLTRVVTAGSGYASQSSKVLHFGVGKNATVKRLTVTWPSGTVTTRTDVAANQSLQLVEKSASAQR